MSSAGVLTRSRTIITAAASGIGAAGCEVFAEEGATVAAVDIDEARLAEVVGRVTKAGGKAKGFVADLSKIGRAHV